MQPVLSSFMSSRTVRRVAILLSIQVVPALLPRTVAAQPTLEDTGAWTSLADSRAEWGQTPIHMALLRGDGAYHSKILTWKGDPGPFGLFWGWNEGALDCSSILATDFAPLTLTHPGANIFCSGQAALSSGDLLINSGHEVNFVGIKQSTIFRPNPGAGQSQWQSQGSLSQGRWYPTTVMLSGGDAMTFSGNRFQHVMVLGGTEFPQSSTSTCRDEIQRLGSTQAGEWISAMTRPAPPTPWPDPTEGHVALWHNATNRTMMFGGRTSGGSPLDDVWQLVVSASGSGYDYSWQEIPTHPNDIPPTARTRHAGAVRNDNSIVFVGGLTESGASTEIWRFSQDAQGFWRWSPLNPDTPSGSPGPRYGHAAAFDEPRNRLLLFGGLGAGGAATDDEVWALDFTSNPPVWTRPTLRGSDRPTTRHGHTLVADPTARPAPSGQSERRLLMFGGEGATDVLWELWIAANGELQWRRQTGGTEPGPRSRHSAVWNAFYDRMIVSGGNVGTNQATAETWALDGDLTTWSALETGPTGLAGAAAVLLPLTLNAIDPERFNPTTGQWQLFAPPKFQRTYPFMHLLPSGNLFYAGPSGATQILNLAQTPAAWQAAGTSTFDGGSAIQFRPGEIMKCGSPSGSGGPVGTTARISFDAQDGTAGWTSSANSMFPRVYHNLTVLPDGRVLVTGGLSVQNQEGDDGVRHPEIWDPAAAGGIGGWSGLAILGQDPAVRGYHSAAILLPDGRILSGGGNSRDDIDQTKITIYCPPYLFDGNALADRPVISATPDTVVWGHAFSVATPQAGNIASACLIRPGAVTHGFNADQRYVPLAIRANQPGQDLVLDAPVGSTWAPPGDYLLFLVNTSGVPSVAKWVRVLGQPENGQCADVTPAPIAWAAPDVGRNTMVLTWQAPGGNGGCGTAHSFDVRRSTAAISEGTFYSATRIADPPTPGVTGTEHCMEISNLASCTTYHFAIKTRDAQGNWSKVSNSVSAQTLCSSWAQAMCDGGGLLAGGGGEGGGSLRQTLGLNRARSEPVASSEETAGENSILWATSSGQVTDLRRVTGLTADASGQFAVPLRQVGTWKTSLDQLTLGYVDHATTEVAIAGPDRVLVGTLGAVTSVVGGMDSNVTALTGTDVQPRELRAGEHLTVTLNGPTAKTAVVVEASWRAARSGEDLSGIRVQTPGPDGVWTTVGEIQPRRQFDRSAILVGPNASVRLVFPRTCTVRSLAQLEVDRQVVPEPLELVSATKPDGGAVTVAVGEAGGEATTVAPGDSLTVTFAAPPVSGEGIRELFLLARGSLAPTESQGTVESARLTSEVREPFVNHLGQARPNPSAGEVTIDFTLAQRSPVSFRVYDVSGRLVRSLVNEELAEGPQSVIWDGRNDEGQRVGAGVFFYRLIAGGWHSERKLILLQR